MATVETVLKRKFRRRWSDLQMLVMVELAKGPRAFAPLMLATDTSSSGTWSALRRMLADGLLVIIQHGDGTVIYALTDEGVAELAAVLK